MAIDRATGNLSEGRTEHSRLSLEGCEERAIVTCLRVAAALSDAIDLKHGAASLGRQSPGPGTFTSKTSNRQGYLSVLVRIQP